MTKVRFEKRDINYLVTRYKDGNYEKQVIMEDKTKVRDMMIKSCKARGVTRSEFHNMEAMMKLFKCKAVIIKDK